MYNTITTFWKKQTLPHFLLIAFGIAISILIGIYFQKTGNTPSLIHESYKNNPDAYVIKGKQLLDNNEITHAITVLQDGLTNHPHNIDILTTLGNALVVATDYKRALVLFKKAYMLSNNPISKHNIGYTLNKLGDVHGAIAAYNEVLAHKPDFAESHFDLGCCYLYLGDFARGWPDYEWRFKRKHNLHKYDGMPKPRWDGTNPSNKKIMIVAEQGLGDTFQFIRYVSLLKKQGAHVIFYTQKILAPLLSRCPDIDQIVQQGELFPEHDYYIPLLSLPYLYNTTIDTTPQTIPYIYPDPTLVTKWHKELASDTNIKIGICWNGNPTYRTKFLRQTVGGRSIPYELLSTLSTIPGISLYSLQKTNENQSEQSVYVHHFDQSFDQEHGRFMDTAAVMKNLDLVITIDTSIAHLAGSLGVPVWVLLMKAPDWRWMLNGNTSPWYPTMTLFRQKKQGDWSEVIQRVSQKLQTFTNNKSALPQHKKENVELMQKRVNQLHRKASQASQQNNFTQAIHHYTEMFSLTRSPASAHNIACMHERMGNYRKALSFYDAIIDSVPDYTESHFNRACCLLKLGDFEHGWQEYEWRWKRKHNDGIFNFISAPRWDGSSLQGERILIIPEQGRGDTFQFIRYAQLLKNSGAYVIILALHGFETLLKSVPYIDQVCSKNGPVPQIDFYIPLLSIPSRVKTVESTIPADIPYLNADQQLIQYWKTKVAHDTNFKIGICWSGNTSYKESHLLASVQEKSIPLERLAAAISPLSGISLYSLQKMDSMPPELKTLFQHYTITSFHEELDKKNGAFMDTMALMKNLDLVITVDTSLCHCAGALGIPVWTLLPFHSDWRWLTNRTDTPWYPTMKLFQQTKHGDWNGVMQSVAAELKKKVGHA